MKNLNCLTVEMQKSWDEQGFVVFRNVFNPRLMEVLLKYYRYLEGRGEVRLKRWGKGDTFERGGYIIFEAFTDVFSLFLTEQFGENYLPAFSFCRAYKNQASLYRHVDRDGCEIACTMPLLVDSEHPWPLFVSLDKNADGTPVYLDVGDVLIYKGNDVYHWREPYQGKEQLQLFMFGVLEKGESESKKYDGRPALNLDMKKLLMIESEEDRWNQNYAEMIQKFELILEKTLNVVQI